MTRTKTTWTAALAGLALAASAGAAFAQQAAPNAAIPNALNAIRPNEIQQAQQQNPQVIEQFGGTVDPRLNGYVAAVGRKIAAQTGVSGGTGAFTVTVLNSPVRNAFSVPGGYVYVTRELLAMMNDEAELGFVLGHEMGHVVARHSQSRQTRSTISSIGAALAGIVSGSDLVGQLAGTVGQGLVLGYSRSQENEADKLGVRFAARAGYDAFAAPRILGGLGQGEAYDSLEGGTAATAPSWTRSHPLSQDRVVRTTALARQLPAPGTVASHNREQYLSAIESMRYGDDPQQGVVEGNRFLHPGLRLAFTAPSGYTLQNGASEVQIAGKGGRRHSVRASSRAT